MIHPAHALFVVPLVLPFRIQPFNSVPVHLWTEIGAFRLLAFPFCPDIPAEEQTEDEGDEADSEVGEGDRDR